jgi:hypothetical protein
MSMYLISAYLIGGVSWGVYLMSMHLIGMYLTGGTAQKAGTDEF